MFLNFEFQWSHCFFVLLLNTCNREIYLKKYFLTNISTYLVTILKALAIATSPNALLVQTLLSLSTVQRILFLVTILFLDSRLDRLRICRLSWHLFKVLRILNSFFLTLDPRRLDNLKYFCCQISLSSPLNTCTLFLFEYHIRRQRDKKGENKTVAL